MITLDSIASLFGGTIPVWFWVLAAIVLVALLVVFGASSSGGKSYDKGDIKIGRNSDGSYYAYDADDGSVLFTGDTKSEVAEFVAREVR